MVDGSIAQKQLDEALPDLSTPVTLLGLDSKVQVYRDAYGIPHVQAATTEDAFFAQGYVTAQDRLWHMDYDRRRAYGRWAEVVGPTAAAQDVLFRRFRLEHSARADYQIVKPETRAMLESYAKGVNAFIETTTSLAIEYALTGIQPEPWQPWDGLAVFKIRHIMMGVFEAKLWRARLVKILGPEATAKLFPGYDQGQLVITPPGAEYHGPMEEPLEELNRALDTIGQLSSTEAGSNSWALDGTRTASGKPLVAGDPHRALEVPNVYYQNHVACPEFDVVGLSFPGLPGFPHFGHNKHVCWCVTHANADYQDLFIERFDQDHPDHYQFNDGWRQAEVHHEVINIKGSQPVEMDVTVTHHGPIIVGDPNLGYGVSLGYTATSQPINAADCLLEMLRTESSSELDEAMRSWVDPVNSFVFADVHGDIRYLTRGQVPVRSKANAWAPVPGWTGDHDWEGTIPFEEMPRIQNPVSSYIVTANNRITGPEYPHYIGFDYTPGFRARRITDRLRELGSKATVEDMVSIHAETVSIPALAYIKALGTIDPLDETSGWAKDQIVAWDGHMDRDAVAPTLYSAFQVEVVKRIVAFVFSPMEAEALSDTGRGGAAHVARLRSRFGAMALEDDRSYLPEGMDWQTILAEALQDGCANLQATMGPERNSWTWGKLHRTLPQHTLSTAFPELAGLLDPPSYPISGDGDTPQAGSFSLSQPYTITGTSVARYVFDLADWSNSRWVVPLGSSGHPGSPNYADQAPVWADVKLLPMLYDWRQIAADAETQQTMEGGTR